MKRIVVYYGTPEGVRVSIDGMGPFDTETATNQMIRGKVEVSRLDSERRNPVGPFRPGNESYLMGEDPHHPIHFMYEVTTYDHIDYQTITEEDLQKELQSRISELSEYLIDPQIEIKCVRGAPLR